MWEDMSTEAPTGTVPAAPPPASPSNTTVTTTTATTTANGGQTTGTKIDALGSLLIPLATIIGLIILIALHDLDPGSGLGLIGGLAGLHSGVAAVRIGNRG